MDTFSEANKKGVTTVVESRTVHPKAGRRRDSDDSEEGLTFGKSATASAGSMEGQVIEGRGIHRTVEFVSSADSIPTSVRGHGSKERSRFY